MVRVCWHMCAGACVRARAHVCVCVCLRILWVYVCSITNSSAAAILAVCVHM